MNDREQAFGAKFASGAKYLDSSPNQLASLKVRGNVGSYHEYQELLHALEHEAGVRSRSVQGDFQGNGYLVEQSKTKVLIVEHETGLEILYIAGSIASLLSLIPLILRCWSVVGGDGRHHPPRFHEIEMRRLRDDGHLIEERNVGLDVPWAAPLSVMNSVMISAAETIDIEIQRLRLEVCEATKRIDQLEKAAGGKRHRTKQNHPKRSTPRSKQ